MKSPACVPTGRRLQNVFRIIETRVSRLPHLTHAASAEGEKKLVRTKPRSWT